jgi:hypothetical protein
LALAADSALPSTISPSISISRKVRRYSAQPLAELGRVTGGSAMTPTDIERTLKKDHSQDSRERSLQLEAKAHIAVLQWVDGGLARGRALTPQGICEIHHRFGEMLPPDLLYVEDAATKERLLVLPRATCSRVSSAAAHHRLLWTLPFLDRNGRVVRLVSHATLLDVAPCKLRPTTPQRPGWAWIFEGKQRWRSSRNSF